jgi:circadian clock protein KaiB
VADDVSRTAAFEKLLVKRDDEWYELKLFVTGLTPRSTEAVATMKEICESLLRGRYDLEVVDLYQHPERAATDDVIAAPTLVRRQPLPVRRMIGSFDDRRRILRGLNLPEDA